MSVADVAEETSVISSPSILQPNELITDTETPAIIDTTITSSSSVLQSSELITDLVAPMAGVTDTTVTSIPIILQSNKSITDITVKRLLDTAPAKVHKMI